MKVEPATDPDASGHTTVTLRLKIHLEKHWYTLALLSGSIQDKRQIIGHTGTITELQGVNNLKRVKELKHVNNLKRVEELKHVTNLKCVKELQHVNNLKCVEELQHVNNLNVLRNYNMLIT